MDPLLEQRIAAIEARLDTLDAKRGALRNQFVALQLLLIKALPLITPAATDQLAAATHAAEEFATIHLLEAGYPPADIHDILVALEALRADMAATGRGDREAPCA